MTLQTVYQILPLSLPNSPDSDGEKLEKKIRFGMIFRNEDADETTFRRLKRRVEYGNKFKLDDGKDSGGGTKLWRWPGSLVASA